MSLDNAEKKMLADTIRDIGDQLILLSSLIHAGSVIAVEHGDEIRLLKKEIVSLKYQVAEYKVHLDHSLAETMTRAVEFTVNQFAALKSELGHTRVREI